MPSLSKPVYRFFQPIDLVGKGRVERHWIIDPKRFKMPAANFPSEGFEGIFYTLDFDKDVREKAYCQEHVPYQWDNTTDIEVTVCWLHDNVDAGKVRWGINYRAIKAGEVVAGAVLNIEKVTAGNHPAGVEIRSTFTAGFPAGALEADDDLAIEFFRRAADALDTLNEDARMINVHFHFIQNKLGKAT